MSTFEFAATLNQTIDDSPSSLNVPCRGAAGVLVHVVSSTSFVFTATLSLDGNTETAAVKVYNINTGSWTAAGSNVTALADDLLWIPTAGAEDLNIVRQSGSGVLNALPGFHTPPGADSHQRQLIPGSDWQLNHNPGANTKATATRSAAGAGIRNVLTAVLFKFVTGAIAPSAVNVTGSIIDGASGGTAIWSTTISAPATAGIDGGWALADLWIPGTANTQMTVEFSAAGGANTLESVGASGGTHR